MKFQRITKFLLLFALCLLMLQPQVAEASASASLSGESSIQAGSDVTLTLKISGSNIMGVEATLNYDSSVLEYRSYSGKLSGWDVVPNGSKFVMYGVGNPINSSTSVVSVTFRVKSGLSADTALSASFSDIVVSDGNSDSNVGTASWSGVVGKAPSNNCAISTLTCSNATLSPSFTSSNAYYTATVPYDVTELKLSWKTADSGARVSVSGNSLVVGENTVTITCTAPSGTQKSYIITVTREQDPNCKPSDVALLSDLKLDAGPLSPTFSGAVTEYVAYVPFETKSATLTGVAKDEKALQVTEDTRQLVNEGETVMSVTCTAEDGVTKKTYTVHVYRMPKYEGIIPTMEIIDPNAEPEIPSFALPIVVTLPVIGEASTLTVAIVAAALVVILLFLLGFLIGRSGRRDDYYDDEPPTPPTPRYREEPPKAAPKSVEKKPVERKMAERAKAEPTPMAKPAPVKTAEKPKAAEKKPMVDDGFSSPFVEDLSSAVQEELHQRRETAADKLDDFFVDSTYSEETPADDAVSTMSLQDLLDDIRNM